MAELFFTDDPQGVWSRAVKAGRARRLTRGVYTEDTTTPFEQVARTHVWDILARLMPDAVITDRTRRDLQLATDGTAVVFCARPGRRRRIDLPGIVISARPGVGPLADDSPYLGGTHIASEARALLENARPTRASGGLLRRTLTREELEDWIARLAAARTHDQLNAIRDRAREIAPQLGLPREQALVDRLIGAALGTSSNPVTSDALRARQRGRARDERRLEMFDQLADSLSSQAVRVLPAPASGERLVFLPFFDAYFSNFIEGTEFEVDVARRIVYENDIPPRRSADAHDILGTYAVVSDPVEMARRPEDPDEFLDLVKLRHRAIMHGRPDTQPGAFKIENNRVGTYTFVHHELVEGTLEQSFEGYTRLLDPFARAVYMMFVISEVHPFEDGNGRVARVMMNVELVASHQPRIVIPTVFRYNYLNALRLLSNHSNADALVAALDYAQRWTARVDWSTYDTAIAELERTNAFVEPREADDRGIRLVLP